MAYNPCLSVPSTTELWETFKLASKHNALVFNVYNPDSCGVQLDLFLADKP